MSANGIAFVKMNGLGNDFVVIDARVAPVRLAPEQVVRICDRAHGVGCDQLVIMEKGDGADTFLRIYNADGGEVAACGNATRCVADLLFREAAGAGRRGALIDTRAGRLGAWPAGGGLISVDMGRPRFAWDEIPLAEAFRDTRAIELQIGPIDAPALHSPSVVNVGNPHAIFWVDDVEAHDLSRIGPLLEHQPIFPERANISLARVTARDAITLKVWERGAGLTRACGTAACAAAVAAARKGLTGRHVTVALPGGALVIDWREDDHIVMTGPAETEFSGTLDAALLSGSAA